MALVFKKKEPVTFGEISEVPKVGAELRMRLSRASFDTEENTNKAITIMGEAFTNNKDEIIEFMRENMGIIDLQYLQAYLIGGESALELAKTSVEKAIAEAQNG